MSIVDRLPPALQKEPIWVELMEVFEEVIAPIVSRVERIERANSMFTADEVNLDLIIEEIGQVFNVEWNSPENKPLAILRRKDELKFKTTAIPIESMLDRAFIGLGSFWDQYYCKKTDAYTVANLVTKDSIKHYGGNLDDYFLTSRGFLRIETSTMIERGISQADVVEVIDGQLSSIIPLHIVFDGIRFVLSATISNLSINTSAESKAKTITVSTQSAINMTAKAAALPLPVHVDTMDVYARHEILNFDDVSLDFWPLDLPLRINDGVTEVEAPVVTPVPTGQLGDGTTAPDTEKQLGDGHRSASESIQLSET